MHAVHVGRCCVIGHRDPASFANSCTNRTVYELVSNSHDAIMTKNRGISIF